MSEYTKGLRELADWFDAHPEVYQPTDRDAAIKIFPPEADLALVVRALGSFDKEIPKLPANVMEPGIIYLSKPFAGATLKVVFNRTTVCKRVVVGQQTVPAAPEMVIPARPERSVDIIEWQCDEPLLERLK